MRTRSCFVIELIIVSLFWGQSQAAAGDSLDYLKRLLQRSAEAELTSDNSSDEAVARVARRPGEAVPPNSPKSPAPTRVVEQTATDREAERAVKKIESKLNRQLDTLQRQLAREETALDARLNELSKKREAALTKNDEKQLEKIQTMEAAAIKEYERRVERILVQAEPKSQSPAAGSNRSGRGDSAKTRQSPPAARQQPRNAEQQPRPKRRRRLWPFS